MESVLLASAFVNPKIGLETLKEWREVDNASPLRRKRGSGFVYIMGPATTYSKKPTSCGKSPQFWADYPVGGMYNTNAYYYFY
jgi:hypothetical protein